MPRRSLALVALLLLVGLLPACGSDGATRAQAGTTTSTSVDEQPAADDDGAADPCVAWRAFLADGDRARVEELLASGPTDEVAEAARQLLGNFEPETVEGQDAHEAAVDVITAALDCGDPALAAASAAYLATPGACDGEAAPPDDGPARAEIVTEGGATTVVMVVCDRFAYQVGYELHGWDGTSLTDLEIEQWVDGAVTREPVIVGGPFVEDDSRIANVYKGRGLGDCGTYQAWVLDGARLILDEARSKEACDGRGGEPATWPLVHGG